MAQRGVEVVLLQGARSPGELLYGDEFRAFANAHPGFRYLPCLSRELPEPGSPQAHADVCHGYVQQFLGQFAPDPEHDIAYLCGNPNMVDACFEALKAHGLPVPRIRREKYVSSRSPSRGGPTPRSEERRVGKEWVSPCRSRGATFI